MLTTWKQNLAIFTLQFTMFILKTEPRNVSNEYLEKGYPIGTGVIEGACRYLIKDRMDITGARWSLKGAEAVLKLRAIKISGDFSVYWKFYEQQQYIKNHKILYQTSSVLEN